MMMQVTSVVKIYIRLLFACFSHVKNWVYYPSSSSSPPFSLNYCNYYNLFTFSSFFINFLLLLKRKKEIENLGTWRLSKQISSVFLERVCERKRKNWMKNKSLGRGFSERAFELLLFPSLWGKIEEEEK